MKLKTPFYWIPRSQKDDANLVVIKTSSKLSILQTWVYNEKQQAELDEILKRINNWDDAIKILKEVVEEDSGLTVSDKITTFLKFVDYDSNG